MKKSSKVTAVILSAILAMSMIGCGSSAEDTASDAAATDAVTDEATDAAASDEATDAADETAAGDRTQLIVGFDADVQIITGTYSNVTSVPIESISLEKDGKYVYLYNEKENTVTKTAVTTGATSDTAYQVTSGLKVGDKIVATPASDYTEDTFKVKVVDKATAKAKSAFGKK